MSYVRFKFSEIADASAALAAVAALEPQTGPSAANAASAARLQAKSDQAGPASAASAATAARREWKTEKPEPVQSAANAASAAEAQAKVERAEPVASRALIPEFELKAAFETLVLASASGVPDEIARRDALTIFKAMIGNDPRLVPPQPSPWRCVVCDEKGTLVPALTPIEGQHRWLHLGCHDAYCRRQAATVEALIRNAGIPTEGRP